MKVCGGLTSHSALSKALPATQWPPWAMRVSFSGHSYRYILLEQNIFLNSLGFLPTLETGRGGADVFPGSTHLVPQGSSERLGQVLSAQLAYPTSYKV